MMEVGGTGGAFVGTIIGGSGSDGEILEGFLSGESIGLTSLRSSAGAE